jgi:uncharacterized protein YydD (DUF2326 family)
MPTVKTGKSKDREATSDIEKLRAFIEDRLDYIESALEDISKRLDKIEKILQDLSEKLEKARPVTRRGPYGTTLLEMVKDNVYLETNKIRAKRTLKRLIDEGKLVLLRDDMLNLEVVTTPDIIRSILKKLPVPVEEADKVFNEREYELLKILNRLGYVLIRDNVYVRSELANEFLKE